MDACFGNDDNGPNGPSGIDASVGDGPKGVHFGWSDGMVDEDSYETHEDSDDSDWLGREHLLSDDDELNAIGARFRVVKKNIKNKNVQTTDLEPPLILGLVVENENEDRIGTAGNGVNEKEVDGMETMKMKHI
ncbi:hypothetical protein V6N13_043672 [Hibiscus sabdariffa]